MKIGIVSDTHDNVEVYGKVASALKDSKVELVLHCGDWVAPYSVSIFTKMIAKLLPNTPVKGVLGNNDGDIYNMIAAVEAEELSVVIERDTLEFLADEKRGIVYHGTDKRIVDSLIQSKQYSIVCTGHTHIPLVEQKAETLHVNPGTVSCFANGSIVNKVSIAVYDTVENKAEIIYFDR